MPSPGEDPDLDQEPQASRPRGEVWALVPEGLRLRHTPSLTGCVALGEFPPLSAIPLLIFKTGMVVPPTPLL